MQCPNCALYHPERYDKCVSCGTKLVPDAEMVPPVAAFNPKQARPTQTAAPPSGRHQQVDEDDGDEEETVEKRKGGLPTALGIVIAGFILLASAGGTFFYLTKPPENQRLYQEGQKQLQLGQYAFALKTLTEAVKAKPDDPRALLALARAYVGVDQVDKAWECIVQAQQLGAGVVAEPELASDLANYYRQHGQYQRAIELLRPLAASNVGGKKSELSDLDASWGDQALQDGDLRQAMHCWEEVKDLHEGARAPEADTRLATIYAKIAEDALRKGDDEDALKYYTKLNAMTPSSASFERTADIYQKQGKLELAIDQMRRAVKASSDPSILNRKLATIMASRGKELLDSGEDADAGYGYLQQAQALDPRTKAPPSTIRSVEIDIDPSTKFAHISGQVWNPGPDPLPSLTLRAELWDNKAGRSLWSKDLRVIDEFVPPLGARDSRPFDLVSAAPVGDPSATEMRVYLNGMLYHTYPFKKAGARAGIADNSNNADKPTLRPRIAPTDGGMPPTAPEKAIEKEATPPPAPSPNPIPAPVPVTTTPGSSPEEKTLKDLD